jgi:hypothetical protein
MAGLCTYFRTHEVRRECDTNITAANRPYALVSQTHHLLVVCIIFTFDVSLAASPVCDIRCEGNALFLAPRDICQGSSAKHVISCSLIPLCFRASLIYCLPSRWVSHSAFQHLPPVEAMAFQMVFSFENVRANIVTDFTFRAECYVTIRNKLCETCRLLIYPLRYNFSQRFVLRHL